MFSLILFSYNPFWYIPFMAVRHSQAYQEWISRDREPPQVFITSPTDGQWVGKNFLVTGTAHDAETGIQKVEVKIGDKSWDIASGTTNWSYSAQWSSNTESLQIQARSYDAAGHVSQVVSIVVKVDVEPPVIAIDESNSDPLIWNLYDTDGKYDIRGTTTDSGGSGVLCTDFKISGEEWEASAFKEIWSYGFDRSSFSYGETLEIILRAKDRAGNENYISRNVNPCIVRSWGGDYDDLAYAIAFDSSNNIYIAGYTNSFGAGSVDAFIIKFDPDGKVLWQKTWGGNYIEYINAIVIDSSSNIYAAGYTSSFGAGSGDAFILKLDQDGNILWQKTWGGSDWDWVNSVAIDSSNNIYLTGMTRSFGAGASAAFILKLDSDGNILWQKTWGGINQEDGHAIAIDSSDNIYVTGSTGSFGAGNGDAFILKLDSDGNILWQKTWGGSEWEDGHAIAIDSSDNIYVVGSTKSFGAGDADAFILKLDSDGNILWQKTWGGIYQEDGYAIAIAPSNNIYVTGSTRSFGEGDADAFILKLDSDGNILWQKTWGGSDADYAYAVVADASGNFYISGHTPDNSGIWKESSGILGDASGSISSPSGTLDSPSGSVTIPGATSQNADGTMDTGAGYTEALIIKAKL